MFGLPHVSVFLYRVSLTSLVILYHTASGVQDYGAYLEADALAAAASCREMEWALQEVLDLAQHCGDYKSKERCGCAPSGTMVSGALWSRILCE